MVWKWYLITENIGKGCIAVLTLEWCCSKEHFVDEDTQGPPIHGTGVSVSFDDLRSNVLLGSNEGVRAEVGNA